MIPGKKVLFRKRDHDTGEMTDKASVKAYDDTMVLYDVMDVKGRTWENRVNTPDTFLDRWTPDR